MLLIASLDQLADQRGGGRKPDAVATLAGGQAAEPGQDGSSRFHCCPNKSTFSLRDRNWHRARSNTSVLLADGMARKSKVPRVLTTGNLACRIRRSVSGGRGRVTPVRSGATDNRGKSAFSTGTLPRHLVVLTQHGGQPQRLQVMLQQQLRGIRSGHVRLAIHSVTSASECGVPAGVQGSSTM